MDKSAFPQIHENLGRDLRGDVDRVYASYFPLVPSKDVCFELGRMLMGLRDYGSAIEFFNKSNEACGPHHITVRVRRVCCGALRGTVWGTAWDSDIGELCAVWDTSRRESSAHRAPSRAFPALPLPPTLFVLPAVLPLQWHNAGICFYQLEDYESALECFKASLELQPDYSEARLWWDRTVMKSASAAAAGGAGAGAGAGTPQQPVPALREDPAASATQDGGAPSAAELASSGATTPAGSASGVARAEARQVGGES